MPCAPAATRALDLMAHGPVRVFACEPAHAHARARNLTYVRCALLRTAAPKARWENGKGTLGGYDARKPGGMVFGCIALGTPLVLVPRVPILPL